VISSKYPYAGVTATSTGNLWTTGQSALNYSNAIVHYVPTGSPGSCTLHFLTGPTAALANVAINDPNYSMTCTSAGEAVLGAVNNYFNINVSALTGGDSVAVYVTLTNFAGTVALSQTIGTANQGTAGAQYWLVEPGDGTQGEIQISDGVGAHGAGVLQTAELFTLSTAVASASLTQVVAAPSAGVSVYVGRLLIEKATASTGSVTVEYGTGVNCGTGTTVLFGPVTVPPVGMISVGVLVPAAKALCLVTDANTTSVRALTQ